MMQAVLRKHPIAAEKKSTFYIDKKLKDETILILMGLGIRDEDGLHDKIHCIKEDYETVCRRSLKEMLTICQCCTDHKRA